MNEDEFDANLKAIEDQFGRVESIMGQEAYSAQVAHAVAHTRLTNALAALLEHGTTVLLFFLMLGWVAALFGVIALGRVVF